MISPSSKVVENTRQKTFNFTNFIENELKVSNIEGDSLYVFGGDFQFKGLLNHHNYIFYLDVGQSDKDKNFENKKFYFFII